MTRIEIDGKKVLFKCNPSKNTGCRKSSCMGKVGTCQHTANIEAALWDGEKQFDEFGGVALIEK